jgi:hypothetical protein
MLEIISCKHAIETFDFEIAEKDEECVQCEKTIPKGSLMRPVLSNKYHPFHPLKYDSCCIMWPKGKK